MTKSSLITPVMISLSSDVMSTPKNSWKPPVEKIISPLVPNVLSKLPSASKRRMEPRKVPLASCPTATILPSLCSLMALISSVPPRSIVTMPPVPKPVSRFPSESYLTNA
ncbi:hypothetical protein Pla100_60620 [Neorhodopirellula pilleata]|uniref:Uncharacterized protein n=1 Tax=Neorhodopirellula pilleata TaxID=2714738 RepID=A0A5C5ZHA1_9BACT|nr:hypothetical protein Pla100_60620 [Neorhodopirellula pilleata]